MRDQQRNQVYSAQNRVEGIFDNLQNSSLRLVELYGQQLFLPNERKFADLVSIQSYVDNLLTLITIRRLLPVEVREKNLKLLVRSRRSAAAAHFELDSAGKAVLAIAVKTTNSKWALRELVVLHEFAHFIASFYQEYQHGPIFCGVYCELLAQVLGYEVKQLMQTNFLQESIKIDYNFLQL